MEKKTTPRNAHTPNVPCHRRKRRPDSDDRRPCDGKERAAEELGGAESTARKACDGKGCGHEDRDLRRANHKTNPPTARIQSHDAASSLYNRPASPSSNPLWNRSSQLRNGNTPAVP